MNDQSLILRIKVSATENFCHQPSDRMIRPPLISTTAYITDQTIVRFFPLIFISGVSDSRVTLSLIRNSESVYPFSRFVSNKQKPFSPTKSTTTTTNNKDIGQATLMLERVGGHCLPGTQRWLIVVSKSQLDVVSDLHGHGGCVALDKPV